MRWTTCFSGALTGQIDISSETLILPLQFNFPKKNLGDYIGEKVAKFLIVREWNGSGIT
jgi:hypothetical protein